MPGQSARSRNRARSAARHRRFQLVEQIPDPCAAGDRAGHDDVADQALGNGLTFFKRELSKILAQQLAKERAIFYDLLPMDALLPRVGSLPAFLGNLVLLRSEFLTPCLQLMEIDNLGLIGIE